MNLYNDGSFVNETENETQQTTFTYEEYLKYKTSCEEVIELGERAKRLAENTDFVALIMEDYFVKEPTRLAALMASGRITGKSFDGCVEDMKSIGHLRTFLTNYIQKANIAKNELGSLQEAYNAALDAGMLNPNDLN